MAQRESTTRRRNVGGEWETYLIDDSDDYRVQAPDSLPDSFLYPNPVVLYKQDHLKKGKYVIGMEVRGTFTGRKGRMYYKRFSITREYKASQKTPLRSALESIIEDWISTEFTSDSPPEIDILEYDVAELQGDANLSRMPMFGVPINLHAFFKTATADASASVRMQYAKNMDIEHHASGTQCVVDYLLWEAAKMDSRKGHWTRKFLVKELGHAPTVEKIISFAQKEGDVSVFAVDCMMKVFAKHMAVRKPRVFLVFMVKERHALPITNDKWRRYITREGGVPLEQITFHRWSFDEAEYCASPSFDDWMTFVNKSGDGAATRVRVLPVDEVEMIAAQVVKDSGLIVERTAWSRSHMTAFEHPAHNIVIVAGRDFEQRRDFCSALFDKYRVDEFLFTNQGWGTLAQSLLNVQYAAVPTSSYTAEYLDIVKRYPLGPYRVCLTDDRTVKPGDMSVDIRRCYSAVLRNMPENWPVFGPLDHVRALLPGTALVLRPGEYYVARTFKMGKGNIKLSRGWYPTCLVRYALAKGYIQQNDVTYEFAASLSIQANTFTDFCDFVDKTYPDHSKDMLNMLVGIFGSQHKTVTRSGSTADLETAVATLANIQLRGNEGSLMIYNGIAILQETERTQRTNGHLPLYRAILSSSYVLLDELTNAVSTDGTTVLGYNTDSLKVRGPLVVDKIKVKDECAWGEWHAESHTVLAGRPLDELPEREEYTLTRPDVLRFKEADGDNYSSILKESGALIMGPPGCGKTFLLCSLYAAVEDKDTCIVTAYTHAACQNLRDKGLPARVYSSLVFNPRTQRMDASMLDGCKTLILDEYTMLPPSEMRVLLAAKAAYGFRVWAAGDFQQCTAPVDNPVEYHTNPLFLHMCDNVVVELKYKTGSGRYDESLHAAIDTLRTTGQLKAWKDQPVAPFCYANICYTNAKRNALNAACFKQWLEDNEHGEVFNAGFGKRPFPICQGLPVMAYHGHIHEHDILKTQVWTILAVNMEQDAITIGMEGRDGSVTLTVKSFRDVFDYCFAMTVQKCQGLTVQEFVVHELNHPRMTFNTVYTAVSRGVTLGKVHLADVSNWDRVYEMQKTDGCTLLTSTALVPRLYPVHVYRVVPFSGAPAYIGHLTGEEFTSAALLDELEKLQRADCRPVGMPEPDLDATIDLIETVWVRDLEKAADIEKDWVQKECDTKGCAYNRPETVLAATEAAGDDGEATAAWHFYDDTDGFDWTADDASSGRGSNAAALSTGGGASEARQQRKRKFEPVLNVDRHAFMVRCRSKGVATEDQTKWFTYIAGDDDDMERARTLAEVWAATMREQYF